MDEYKSSLHHSADCPGTHKRIRTSDPSLRSDLGTPVLRDFLYLKIPYFQGFFALRVLSCVTEFLLILPRF